MFSEVDELLHEMGMHYSQIDYKALTQDFMLQAENKLTQRPSTIMMIPSYIATETAFEGADKVVAIDAGGTHLRIADIEITETGYPRLLSQDKYLIQDISREHTAEGFFRELAKAVKPHMKFSKKIGVSFAFPGFITEDKDMIIDSMSKEVVINDIEGKSIRRGLISALADIGATGVCVNAINDTVASLLGASGINGLREYGACVGLILGTGMNTCLKLRSLNNGVEKCDVYNSESGMYAICGGEVDKYIDEHSLVPGDHKFEKMVSGKYLSEIVELCVSRACEKGILPIEKKEKYLGLDGTRLSTLLASQTQDAQELVVKELAQKIVLRAAKLICANIAAWVLLYGKKAPALIVTEGSTVNKLFGFKESLDNELKKVLLYENKINYDIISVDDAVVKGAAVACLL